MNLYSMSYRRYYKMQQKSIKEHILYATSCVKRKVLRNTYFCQLLSKEPREDKPDK